MMPWNQEGSAVTDGTCSNCGRRAQVQKYPGIWMGAVCAECADTLQSSDARVRSEARENAVSEQQSGSGLRQMKSVAPALYRPSVSEQERRAQAARARAKIERIGGVDLAFGIVFCATVVYYLRSDPLGWGKAVFAVFGIILIVLGIRAWLRPRRSDLILHGITGFLFLALFLLGRVTRGIMSDASFAETDIIVVLGAAVLFAPPLWFYLQLAPLDELIRDMSSGLDRATKEAFDRLFSLNPGKTPNLFVLRNYRMRMLVEDDRVILSDDSRTTLLICTKAEFLTYIENPDNRAFRINAPREFQLSKKDTARLNQLLG